MARTEEPAASPGTIRCPSCGHANRADRRFCAKCGARLGEVCAACGTQNDPDENFCSQCGAALSAATALSAAAKPVVRQEPPEAEKLPAGERRQLTVVFCDLVGSTALSQQLDPEEWRAVVVEYLKAAGEAVARHGGHVAKTLGDGPAERCQGSPYLTARSSADLTAREAAPASAPLARVAWHAPVRLI